MLGKGRRFRLAGVPHIHPHQYRHTWAHQYRKSGSDRGDLKRLGGWKSGQMVDRYGCGGNSDGGPDSLVMVLVSMLPPKMSCPTSGSRGVAPGG